MEMKSVESSNIEAVGYDHQTQTLAVRFKSGGTYHYHDVPAEEHRELLQAPSIGGHFHSRIKGAFSFSKH